LKNTPTATIVQKRKTATVWYIVLQVVEIGIEPRTLGYILSFHLDYPVVITYTHTTVVCRCLEKGQLPRPLLSFSCKWCLSFVAESESSLRHNFTRKHTHWFAVIARPWPSCITAAAVTCIWCDGEQRYCHHLGKCEHRIALCS
jgi:hypothetical protein